MFGLIRKRKQFIFYQWYVPLLDFSSNTGEFYTAVEAELKKRQVPALRVERIKFRQAGWFSENHEYLRLGHERLAFDFGSAQCGTSWWFSARAAVLPRRFTKLELILAFLGFGSFCLLYLLLFGMTLGSIVLGVTLLAFLVLFWLGRAWSGLDECLMWMPVVGAFYEGFFRRETYHRQDQRRMIADIVMIVGRAKVREFCALGGVTDPEFCEVATPEQILTAKQLKKFHPGEVPVEA